MPHHTRTLTIATDGPALHEFTEDAHAFVASAGVATGLLTAFCRHTSASVLITENAAPAVRSDLVAWLARVAPESGAYAHDSEGPDDMPAHLKQVLTGASVAVPVARGALMLGTWQGLFLSEHRAAPHTREVVLHLSGE